MEPTQQRSSPRKTGFTVRLCRSPRRPSDARQKMGRSRSGRQRRPRQRTHCSGEVDESVDNPVDQPYPRGGVHGSLSCLPRVSPAWIQHPHMSGMCRIRLSVRLPGQRNPKARLSHPSITDKDRLCIRIADRGNDGRVLSIACPSNSRIWISLITTAESRKGQACWAECRSTRYAPYPRGFDRLDHLPCVASPNSDVIGT